MRLNKKNCCGYDADKSFLEKETVIEQRPVKDVKMIDNLSEFVLEAGPEDYLVRCRVTRCNRGLDRGEGVHLHLGVLQYGLV